MRAGLAITRVAEQFSGGANRLDDLVNHSFPAFGRPGGKRFGAAVATYLGVTQAELRTELQAGKSLAHVRLARACLAAKGRALGTGYVDVPGS